MQPKRVVYISCGPDTLARDLRMFAKHGYKAKEAWPVDLFGWTEHVETEEPGEQEIARWVGVFEDWYRAQGKTARASPGKIAKWLKNPRTDSAEYKAYGNSVAVPCVFFVLAGIAWAEEMEVGSLADGRT